MPPDAPSGEWLTRQLRRAEQHAENVAPLLEEALIEALDRIGEQAAAGFTRHAVDFTARTAAAEQAPPGYEHLAAAADSAEATMVCLKPTAEQAAALELEDGEPAGILHVTLAYLGKTTGPLTAIVEALRPVAMRHASLFGVVGGYGSFADNGDGHPLIALPSVPGLVELRVDVTEALTDAGIEYGRDYGYLPHMTLAYQDFPALPGALREQSEPLTFAELYVIRGDVESVALPLSGRPPITAAAEIEDRSRVPIPGVDGWHADMRGVDRLLDLLDAEKAELGARDTVYDRIRAVAEEHASAAVGYGDTWYRAGVAEPDGSIRYDEGTVFWTPGDWTTDEELEAIAAAFLAIDGVGAFECEAESRPTPWMKVWPVGPEIRASALAAACRPLLHQRFAGDDRQAPASWAAPAPDEIIDARAVVAAIAARTKPVRDAAVAAAATPVLEGAGLAFDVKNPLVGYVLAQAGSQIVDIAATTQLNVMRIVRHSYEAGLSIPNTAEAIREGMHDASPARARLIARTELAGAVNGGSLAAVQIVERATGTRYGKVWMTAPHAKHPRHYLYDGLNGQRQPLTGKFQVGGAELAHPGDPEGPPREICNCRCTMRYDEGAPDPE